MSMNLWFNDVLYLAACSCTTLASSNIYAYSCSKQPISFSVLLVHLYVEHIYTACRSMQLVRVRYSSYCSVVSHLHNCTCSTCLPLLMVIGHVLWLYCRQWCLVVRPVVYITAAVRQWCTVAAQHSSRLASGHWQQAAHAAYNYSCSILVLEKI